MRVLITGASGLLGAPLVETYRLHHEVAGLSRQRPLTANVDWFETDLAVSGEFYKVAEAFRPDIIVHTAALTNVDECERNPALAVRLNCDSVAEIAQWCKAHGAKLVHVSTDAVFSGTKTDPYVEVDQAAPPHVYGRTKLEAETFALAAPRALVLRTNVFGWRPGRGDSLAEWILNGLRKQTRLTMFVDVLFTPIAAQLLAPIIRRCSDLDLAGLYHASGSEQLSKHEFALRIARAYSLPTATIEPISMSLRPAVARRAANISLDSTKLAQVLGRGLPDVEESILAWQQSEV